MWPHVTWNDLEQRSLIETAPGPPALAWYFVWSSWRFRILTDETVAVPTWNCRWHNWSDSGLQCLEKRVTGHKKCPEDFVAIRRFLRKLFKTNRQGWGVGNWASDIPTSVRDNFHSLTLDNDRIFPFATNNIIRIVVTIPSPSRLTCQLQQAPSYVFHSVDEGGISRAEVRQHRLPHLEPRVQRTRREETLVSWKHGMALVTEVIRLAEGFYQLALAFISKEHLLTLVMVIVAMFLSLTYGHSSLKKSNAHRRGCPEYPWERPWIPRVLHPGVPFVFRR